MVRDRENQNRPRWNPGNLLENLFIVALVFYPLRHITWGLDLWDTGYHYANFQYMGTRHMDPMWLFSTYLATAVGNKLMGLPNADTMMGMNLYTGLFVSAMALIGYFFCTRKLKMPRGIVFLGEMTAISMCWCPTAALYNYLTYLFFLTASIFLYLGLTREKRGFLIAAGALLGANVLVRFPNLAQAAMILAVWSYDLILWLEDRRAGRIGSVNRVGRTAGWFGAGRSVEGGNRYEDGQRAGLAEAAEAFGAGRTAGTPADTGLVNENGSIPADGAGKSAGQKPETGKAEAHGIPGIAKRAPCREGFWHRTMRHTGWCLLGYAVTLAVLLHYIHICYGIDEYIAGIGRLFAMTDKAADYKPMSMVMGIIGRYVECLYWVVRIGVIVLGGMALFALAGWLENMWKRYCASGNAGGKLTAAVIRILWGTGGAAVIVWLYSRDFFSFLHYGYGSIRYPAGLFLLLALLLAVVPLRILWGIACAGVVMWLYSRNFFSFLYYSYDSIWHPGPMFLLLTMLVAAVRVFHRDSPREEKLISGMLILIILLTSIGGNNGVFPSLNNLFLAAPYTLWELWRFLRHVGDKRIGKWLVLSSFPAKGILVTLTALCLFQFACFGAGFVFAESTGIQQADSYVENNVVLKNIKMEPDKARWMTELSAYANENALSGREVILYGDIPSLSYYLQMPSAFNPWSDLDSFNPEMMEAGLAQQKALVREKGQEKPVIILEHAYASYLEEAERTSLSAPSSGERETEPSSLPALSPEQREVMDTDLKWKLLREFMEELGYEQDFRNGKFAVYR